MESCEYSPCYSKITNDAPDYPYCTRKCFEADITMALKISSAEWEPITSSFSDLSRQFDDSYDLRKKICALRDDAENRVKNIETFGAGKVLQTKEYFQARADVLNDLLCMLPVEACSCR